MTTNHKEKNKVIRTFKDGRLTDPTNEPRWYRLAKMKYGDIIVLEIANYPNREIFFSQNENFVCWLTERIEWQP